MADTQIIEEWLPTRIHLIDQSKQLTECWAVAFDKFPEIEVRCDDYFRQPADALVCPTNSFGNLDHGIDRAIRDRLGEDIQRRVHLAIIERHHGELPVGTAEIIETGHKDWPNLICVPVMRVPESVAFTLNAYLAFRAALVAIENLNRNSGRLAIQSLVCCGLGTGVGGMAAGRCSAQMRIAYRMVVEPAMIRRLEAIQEIHAELSAT